MRLLYFDCFSGISGDMMLGALLDLGIDKELFKIELSKLKLTEYDILIEKKSLNSISVTDVEVIIKEYNHNHDLNYELNNKQNNHHNSRNLNDIKKLIECSDLKSNVKEFSVKVFMEIAKAEAKVHNLGIEEIHFHEVGAVDSIIDIVGVAICIDLLNITTIFSSPLHDGKGFIKCQHGLIPVPVPAVMEMLVDSKIPFIIDEEISTELVTPTGLGLIKCLASEFGNMPPMTIERIGLGGGKRKIGRINALRVIVGTLFEQYQNTDEVHIDEVHTDEVAIIETNIDDMSPEILGYVMEKLLKEKALDVYYTSIYMKKNRPSFKLTVLVEAENEERLVDIILRRGILILIGCILFVY